MDDNSQCVFALESLLRLDTPESSVSLMCFIWNLCRNQNEQLRQMRHLNNTMIFQRKASQVPYCEFSPNRIRFAKYSLCLGRNCNFDFVPYRDMWDWNSSGDCNHSWMFDCRHSNGMCNTMMRIPSANQRKEKLISNCSARPWTPAHTLSLVFVMFSETLMSSDEKKGDTPDTRLVFFSSVLKSKYAGDSGMITNEQNEL